METTKEDAQRLVLIQDASREVSVDAVRWIMDGFSLKPRDVLTLLLVLHQVNNPMGYKSRIDRSIFGANQKIIDDEIVRIVKEYEDNMEFVEISKLYETQKIEFKIQVQAGPSPKMAALESAKKLNATWVILDRQLKKDKSYFLQNLSCGISRMKRDNRIEKLRGPKPVKTGRCSSERRISFSTQVSYDEMLPGSAEDEEDLFSIELFPTNSLSTLGSPLSTRSSISEASTERSRMSISIRETVRPLHEVTNSIREKFPFDSNGANGDRGIVIGYFTPDEGALNNPICGICKNARPIIKAKNGIFSYSKLLQATNGFSTENLISRGVYGAVFRGKLKSRLNIAVKQQRDASTVGEKKFNTEVQTLSKIRHKNIIMLLGSSPGKDCRFLVYEYVCNGSLDQHISGQRRSPLTWNERMKIAQGMSRGLHHLHENRIIHRDVTPKNVFLTHDFEPVLGGFGLARTLIDSELRIDHHIVGSFGYLAPEYAESGKATTKSDVYSLGVVLLELITGRSVTDERLEGKSLLRWARPLIKEMKSAELIDARIVINSHDRRQFMLMVQVAGKCLSKDPWKRLSVDQVVSMLELIKEGKTSDEIKTSIHERSNSSGTPPAAWPDEDGLERSSIHGDNDAIDPGRVLATPLLKQAKEYFESHFI